MTCFFVCFFNHLVQVNCSKNLLDTCMQWFCFLTMSLMSSQIMNLKRLGRTLREYIWRVGKKQMLVPTFSVEDSRWSYIIIRFVDFIHRVCKIRRLAYGNE